MPIDFKPAAKIDFKPVVPVEPSNVDKVDKHGNIHKPDGTIVHSSFEGKERVDRRFLDTDKMRSSMINFASKTPFPNVVGGFGDLAIQGLELFNDPEAVAGGPLIKRGLSKINPKVTPQVRPQVEIPNATAAPVSGSREVIPVKPQVSTPISQQPNITYESIRGKKPAYHGTQKVFEKFEPKEGGGVFSGMTHFSEDPTYASLYSTGWHAGTAKSQGIMIPSGGEVTSKMLKGAKPNVIAGIPEGKHILDLTNPISESDLNILTKVLSKDKANELVRAVRNTNIDDNTVWTLDDVINAIDDSEIIKKLPYDAYRYRAHGQINWAIPSKGKIKTPGGLLMQGDETISSQLPAQRIRTSDPTAGRNIMAEIESMPKKMPQVESIAKSPTPATSAVNKTDELGFIRKTVSEARALQTSMDLSAPLRQGVTQIHTKEFWKNLKPMFDAARSEEGFKKLSDEIEGRDTYRLMQRAGVEFTDVSKALAKREESMRGTFVEKWVPGVRASNRAYTLFLNKLRADTFDRMAKNTNLLDDVVDDTDEVSKGAKAIAKFVNDATGRGSLGSWEKSAVALNDVFFSPKLIASRVNMLGRAGKATFENISRTGADDAVSKALRKEALKSMIGYGTLGTMSANISIMGGAEGTEDPKSTDFGKLKIGNTRIDMTGGFQQYFRVASQLSTNLATAIAEENNLDIPSFLQNEQNAGDTAWRFLRNKLSPSVASLVDLLQGENVIGEEVSRSPKGVGKEILELVTPLIIDDLIELIREDPKMLPAILPAFFGAGIQSYGAINRTRGNRNNMPSIEMPQMPSISN